MAINLGPKIPVMVSGASGDTYLTQGNALLRMLQALVQPNVINMTTTTPPPTPSNGDMYVVAPVGAGGWLGKDNQIAYWSTDNPNAPAGEWEFYTPIKGWRVTNQFDGYMYNYTGTAWVAAFNVFDPTGSIPGSLDNHVVTGQVTVANGTALYTVNLVGQAVFTAAGKYQVIFSVDDNSKITAVVVNRVSGSQFTFNATGAGGGATLQWIAIGT